MKAFVILLAFAFSMTATPSFAENQNNCELIQCKGSGCGCELLKAGWRELARCEGHQWTYVIEKGSERKLCTGIAALAVYEENPCVKFERDLKEFKKCGLEKK